MGSSLYLLHILISLVRRGIMTEESSQLSVGDPSWKGGEGQGAHKHQQQRTEEQRVPQPCVPGGRRGGGGCILI